jgi:hypothetical protein
MPVVAMSTGAKPDKHLTVFLRVMVALMAPLAALKLGDELLRLVWRSGSTAAIDLKQRYDEVQAWFSGVPAYHVLSSSAAYPPATYPLLWPFMGWTSFATARVLWAVTSALALAWTAFLVSRESGAATRLERAFVVLTLLAVNQTGVALGNGQLILHVLPVLLTGILLIQRGSGTWREDLLAAVCLIFALVKVTITVPFLWLAIIVSGAEQRRSWRLRPAILVTVGYVALTLFAASFQPGTVWQQTREWLTIAEALSRRAGYGNMHSWLTEIGMERLMFPASVVLLLGLGAWLDRYRRADIWVRLGVAAMVARFWTYHRLYDDVIVVVALVAVTRRLLKGEAEGRARRTEAPRLGKLTSVPDELLPAMLLGVTILFMLLPARLGIAPAPWYVVFNEGHTLTWLAVLAYLMYEAHREESVRVDQRGEGRLATSIGT